MNIEFLQSIALSVANEQSAKVVFSKIEKGLLIRAIALKKQ